MSIFQIHSTDNSTKARTGTVSLPNGNVKTPVFMPIGTAGTVKALTNDDLKNLDAEIILGNTYHLWLKPGMETMRKAGGLHQFNAWDRPILTDSGGFQAFSLSEINKFTEDGVTFKLPTNGDMKFLSPELSMQIQTDIGSDIALVLDECLPAEVTKTQAKNAMDRTQRWAVRSQEHWNKLERKNKNVLFGIPQGAQFLDLRKESATQIMDLDFAGYSIGGVANGGEPEEMMYKQVLAQTEILEESKPRHLLGVGTPKDIVQMVARGIDMFDCVYPTRNARHGSLMFELDDNSYESVQITNQRYEHDFTPISADSSIPELRMYTRAYLRHLFKAKELLGFRLATLQNLDFYIRLMKKIRTKIEDGSFGGWYEQYQKVTRL